MMMGRLLLAAVLLGSLSACGGKDTVASCDDATAYQSVVAGKRVEVPDGLDPLDEFNEMPIPKAQSVPRPEGSGCLESPPSILNDG
jgi:uncharacterized lipoprotein